MRGRLLPILVCVAGACLIGLLVYGVTTQSANRTLDEAVAKGQHPPAPQAARTLPVLSGTAGDSLAAYRGKVVVLNFWASWCVPCQTEAPLLERAQSRLQQHQGTVLGVTYLDASTDSKVFVREHRITYPNLRDTTGEFAHAYGTDQLPESFVIDRNGAVVAVSRGEIEQPRAGSAPASLGPFLDKAIKLAESSS
ncbi:MAG TPA: TlpA disulfide reductase family protein [Solirubrobacteraceae bacterium]|nr:TlpA disulfide reductase family protein [Solirubrobacteraceae bacterium]